MTNQHPPPPQHQLFVACQFYKTTVNRFCRCKYGNFSSRASTAIASYFVKFGAVLNNSVKLLYNIIVTESEVTVWPLIHGHSGVVFEQNYVSFVLTWTNCSPKTGTY
jgi:hypothetical protein